MKREWTLRIVGPVMVGLGLGTIIVEVIDDRISVGTIVAEAAVLLAGAVLWFWDDLRSALLTATDDEDGVDEVDDSEDADELGCDDIEDDDTTGWK